jgi:membrane protein implicated in regulation of membrane protease activity
MPAHRLAAWGGIAALIGIAMTSFFVDGLQYSVVTFVPFLLVMSIVYARRRGEFRA